MFSTWHPIADEDLAHVSPFLHRHVIPNGTGPTTSPPSYRGGQLVVEYATVCFRSQEDFGANAEGEIQAAQKLVQAASMISAQPIALQLRFLQTMKEISSEHNTTTILPVPINLFAPLIKRSESQTPKEP